MWPGDRPHGLIEDLGAELGCEATLRLIAVFGGASLYVPCDPTPGHPLECVLGRSAFARLVNGWGGLSISIPVGGEFDRLRRLRRVARLLSTGLSVPQVAQEVGLTERHVRNLGRQAARLKLDGRRLPEA